MNKLILIRQKQNRSRIVFLGVTLGHLNLIVLKCCTERLAQLLDGTDSRTGLTCVPVKAAAPPENAQIPLHVAMYPASMTHHQLAGLRLGGVIGQSVLSGLCREVHQMEFARHADDRHNRTKSIIKSAPQTGGKKSKVFYMLRPRASQVLHSWLQTPLALSR